MLEIKDLKVEFHMGQDKVQAVDGVSLVLNPGSRTGLVGESGCGKTVTAMSVLNLLPPVARTQGEILWLGENITTMKPDRLRRIRGAQISMIFQNPSSSLNPVFTVGRQITDVLKLHRRMTTQQARAEGLRLLELVKIPDPLKRFEDYPHQFSGGMCQRIMIAMSVAARPQLLIADEPTASLDVTIQAQIIELLNELNQGLGMSILMISHDLGVIAHMCDEIAIMYLGRIVEYGRTEDVFSRPAHPYTEALLNAVPAGDWSSRRPLYVLSGDIPSPINLPLGCRFAGRCQYRQERCQQEYPLDQYLSGKHRVACFFPLTH